MNNVHAINSAQIAERRVMWLLAASVLLAQPAAAQSASENHTLQGYVAQAIAQNVNLRREGIAVAGAAQRVRQA